MASWTGGPGPATGADKITTRPQPQHIAVSVHSSPLEDPLGADSSRVGLRSISMPHGREDSLNSEAAGSHEEETEVLLRHQQSSSQHTSLDAGASAAGSQDPAHTPAVGAAANMRETAASTTDVSDPHCQTKSSGHGEGVTSHQHCTCF